MMPVMYQTTSKAFFPFRMLDGTPTFIDPQCVREFHPNNSDGTTIIFHDGAERKVIEPIEEVSAAFGCPLDSSWSDSE